MTQRIDLYHSPGCAWMDCSPCDGVRLRIERIAAGALGGLMATGEAGALNHDEAAAIVVRLAFAVIRHLDTPHELP